MLIAPNTVIKLIAGCPLDNTYRHTIYFSSRAAQETYFNSLVRKSFTALSYQRATQNTCRLEAKIADVYDCNYMMFKNDSFENKWFYAFVLNVEYISNTVIEVTYELDVMQTWFMVSCTVGDCFVEREHVLNDNIGWNTIPEGLEQGPYVNNFAGRVLTNAGSRNRVVVMTAFNTDFGDSTGQIIDSTYTGLQYNIFESLSDLDTFLNRAQTEGKSDGIVSMFMIPNMFPDNFQVSSVAYRETVTLPYNYNSLDGYVPKNKKLFTYPYNVMWVATDADYQEYRYELFQDTTGTTSWTVYFVCNPSPSIVLKPDNYAAGAGLTGPNFQYRITITDFPQCPYLTDVFKVYTAQNASSLPVKMIGNFVSGAKQGAAVGSGAGVPVIGAAIGGIAGIIGDVAQLTDLDRKPPQLNGTQTSSADYAISAKNFYYGSKSINRHYAQVLDSFFDMFGYKVNRVKVPNMNTRPYWNYVKCGYVSITGNVPADAMHQIETIFINGITFWKNGTNVGDYSLNNHE